jgi:cell fate regulator YaaT (PSP1 superfamily)
MMQQSWQTRELDALITCREKAAEMGSFEGAKFVRATYNFNGSLLTFSYTAEQRIETGKLARELRKSFRCKVEMRQLGPRDAAKIMGGYGACGETRCCSTFLTEFSPISIKMAKAQGISLNPSEITGMCGRLRCCLVYEYEQYVEARKTLPKAKKRVGTPHGEGKVIDVHPLKGTVTVVVADKRHEFAPDDLVPLEEMEALKQKAAKGCGKNNGGSCGCGKRK